MKTRSTEKEKLDDLNLQGEPLHKALKSLSWINRWFGNHRAVINATLLVVGKEKKLWRIIDLGCGGGDLILAVAKALKKNKTRFSITGIDGNNNTLQYAREKCAGMEDVQFMQADILQDDFKTGACDILITSHFMYHFSEAGLLNFIRNNVPGISTAFICSELERSHLALLLFKFSSFMLPISKLAKQDGRLAIKRSFTKNEWLAMLQPANITAYSLKRVPLFRLRLIIFPDKKS